MTESEIEVLRHNMGFDRPIFVQYSDWLTNVLKGDFGISMYYHQDNLIIVRQHILATLELALACIICSLVISFPISILSLLFPLGWLEWLLELFTQVGQSTPRFWLGIVLINIFAVSLKLLPVSGRGTWLHLIMPVSSISFFLIARYIYIIRRSMLAVAVEPYILAAKARGIPRKRIVNRHILYNSLIAIITLIGLDFADLLGGVVVIENVFAWPGFGRLTLQALITKDLPLIQTVVLFLAITFVLVNFSIDVFYTFLNPAINLE